LKERALYKRAIHRTHAAWPLVELCSRALCPDGKFEFSSGSRPAASRPVRLRLASARLRSGRRGKFTATIANAARAAVTGASALADDGLQLDLFERAGAGSAGRLAG